MKKEFIRFFMRNKKLDFTLPKEQAEKVMNSTQQLIMVSDEKTGKWSGITVNKADIMRTDHDWEEERVWAMKNTPKLDVPSSMPPEKEINIDDFKPDFLKKKDE